MENERSIGLETEAVTVMTIGLEQSYIYFSTGEWYKVNAEGILTYIEDSKWLDDIKEEEEAKQF